MTLGPGNYLSGLYCQKYGIVLQLFKKENDFIEKNQF